MSEDGAGDTGLITKKKKQGFDLSKILISVRYEKARSGIAEN